jgi:hypothetical protein
MMSRASLFAIAVLFLYGAPAYALTRVAPPGNSGATQYQENVPSATGGVPVTNLPAAGGTSHPLPHGVVTQLDRAGAAGRAAAQLADRTAPPVVRHRSTTPGGESSGGSSVPAVAPQSPSVGSQIAGAVIGGSGGGLGLLLPVVLAGSLALAVAVVLVRRKRTH